VEILSGATATFNSDHDTWASGEDPSVRISVLEGHVSTEINVHEVWWADVNEPYSLAKQIRFWMWGLSIWNFPPSDDRPDLPTFERAMHRPVAPGRTRLKRAFVRVQLFLAGLFFFVAAFSLGAAVFLAKRLFGFDPPDFVRVFVNYISGVKLYNQSTREGTGLLPNPQSFLDTLNDPPRVSIRRRMIQAIVAVAFRPAGTPYDRWYILAHSLGSVVAFNGIMEHGQAFANYLPRETWQSLEASGWAGPPRQRAGPPDWVHVPPGPMSPNRPIWLRDNDLVYRDRIFQNFRGLLTYGSPIGKFAELWRVRVPVNKVEPIFQPDAEWINVFDGRDPVAGPLKAFDPALLNAHGVTSRHCPPLRGFGYAASRVLLLSHIRYLTTRNERPPQLSDVVAEWLVAGGSFTPPHAGVGRWYDMRTYWKRVVGSWVWWLAAFLVLAVLGTVSAKGLWDLLIESGHKMPGWATSLWDWMASGVAFWS
jgi:hypothetical protein